VAQDFTTYQDGQTTLALLHVGRESAIGGGLQSLAHFRLRDSAHIDWGCASASLDADGLLSVMQEEGSGVGMYQKEPSYGLSDEEIRSRTSGKFFQQLSKTYSPAPS
jgi:molecular chaperone HscA